MLGQQMRAQNIILDILESHAFQQYSTISINILVLLIQSVLLNGDQLASTDHLTHL